MATKKVRRLAMLAWIPLRLLAGGMGAPAREARQFRAAAKRDWAEAQTFTAAQAALDGPTMRAQARTAAFLALFSLCLALAPLPEIGSRPAQDPPCLLQGAAGAAPAPRAARAAPAAKAAGAPGSFGRPQPFDDCDDGSSPALGLTTSESTRAMLGLCFFILATWWASSMWSLRIWDGAGGPDRLASVHRRLALGKDNFEKTLARHEAADRRARRLGRIWLALAGRSGR